MATRTLIIDLTQGSGNEPMYGVVTVQRIHSTTQGNFEILPWETTLKLVDGKATIEDAVTDGTGPIYDSAYLIRVMNGYCAPRWGFMAALPDGDTPITTGEMPKVNPLTGEGVYMDAQEWNALYGQLPNKVTNLENRISVLDSKGQRGYTVDQSAGRAVKVWDYLNNREQLIYGDTGTRNISSLLVNATGAVYLTRQGNTVTLDLAAVVPASTLTSGSTILSLPSGFRPTIRRDLPLPANNTGSISRAMYIFASGGLGIWSPSTTDSYRISLTFPTVDPWPTILPGAAA